MFRSEVSVLSFISVEDREGSLTAQLTGVSLELYCVLLTNMTAGQQDQSNIRISHFSVNITLLFVFTNFPPILRSNSSRRKQIST